MVDTVEVRLLGVKQRASVHNRSVAEKESSAARRPYFRFPGVLYLRTHHLDRAVSLLTRTCQLAFLSCLTAIVDKQQKSVPPKGFRVLGEKEQSSSSHDRARLSLSAAKRTLLLHRVAEKTGLGWRDVSLAVPLILSKCAHDYYF